MTSSADLAGDATVGVASSAGLAGDVCYDCLCLMALFRSVMYLAHYWAERIVWTGPDEGSGRYIARA